MDQEEKSTQESGQAPKAKAGVKHGVGHIILELLATVLILSAVAIGFFVWRLTTGPIDIAFIKPTIKDALRDNDTGINIDFEEAVLQWPDLKGPLLLGLRGGKIYDGEGNLIVGVDSAALSLNKAKLFLAQVSPEGLILRKPSLLLHRSEDNEFSIGLDTVDVDDAAEGDISLDDLLDIFRKQDSKSGGELAKLKLVKIEDAKVMIDDKVLSQSWQIPRVDLSLRREREGMRSSFNIDLPRLPKTPTSIVPNIEGDIFAGWSGEQIQIDSVLSQFHTRFLSDKIPELSFFGAHDIRVDATAKMVLGPDFSPLQAEVVMFSKNGYLNIPEYGEDNLDYSDFGVSAVYDGESRVASLKAVKFSLEDVTFNAQAELKHNVGGFEAGFTAEGRLGMQEVKHSQIVPLWPKALEDDNSKEWVIDKLSKGVFHDVYTEFEVAAIVDENEDLSFKLNDLIAGYDFDNLDVKYKNSMAPATNGSGKGSFDYKSETIRIDLDSANILDMDVTKAELIFSNIIEAGAGQADLNIQVNGPFQSMLRYLSDDPINIELDGNISDVKGRINSRVRLKFPTKDDILKEEVDIDVEGEIADAYLPMVVRDLPLSGGPYTVSVKDGVFNLSGKGQLDERNIDLNYSEFLFSEGKPYSSKTLVKMTTDNALRQRLGVDLSDFLSGSAFIDLTYTKRNDGSAVADVKADITEAQLYFDPFDYRKAVGEKGDVSLKAHLENEDLTKVTQLRLNAPNVALEPSVLGFKIVNGQTELSSGTISAFEVGETRGKIDFEILTSGTLNLSMDASFLDMRPFLNDDGEGEGQDEQMPMRISVDAARMRSSDGEIISQGKIFADLNRQGRFNQLEFDAVAGDGDLYMRFKPDASGKRIFRLEADDAGATLQAFDLYNNVRGGKLIIYGEPVRGDSDRNLIGKARMSDFRVVQAPGLARIIGAMSLPGAAEMLAGEGLVFSKLEADFDWLSRPEGSLLVVQNGRTSGNSLGLTFEGTYDDSTNEMDIGGTIIPLSGINNLLQNIPLVGNILGGSSGLFAATYKIRGTGKDASVSVNPLSVLAPGILRSILFESNAADVPNRSPANQNVPVINENSSSGLYQQSQ